jgi:cell division protein FtsI (penicillin-binding protein 3)
MVKGKMTYQASFVGYFPADNPKYSCIVVVSAPTGDAYYGGAVAGPVFKDVADKVYSTSLEIHKEINAIQPQYSLRAPSVKQGSQTEIETVLKTLKVKMNSANENAEWVSTRTNDSVSVILEPKNPQEILNKGIMPNLFGMTARDVLYLLEPKGIRVKIIGSGAVATQSIEAGTAFQKGTQLIIQLI